MSIYDRLLEGIIECVSEGIIGINKSGKIVIANCMSETILNIKKDKLLGKKYCEITINESLKDFIDEIFNSDNPGAGEKIIDLQENRSFSVFLVPMVKENKIEGLIGIIREITELKNIETSMIEFVGNISHEFRTPLTSIKGYVETLLEGALTDEVVCRRFLQVINEEANRLVRLTVNIGNAVSPEKQKGKMSKTELANISDIINNILEVLYPFAQQYALDFEVICPNDLPLVIIDIDQIKQVLINLVDNAIKYTGLKGKGNIKIEVVEGNRDIHISVIDTGVGIPPEDIDKIFQRFYRVDRGYTQEIGGTGIGLAIAKEIVESFGGKMTVESEVDKGSKFTFTVAKNLPSK